MPSSRGGKFGYVAPGRHKAYNAILKRVGSETVAARIANAGRTKAGRSRMARKAARSR